MFCLFVLSFVGHTQTKAQHTFIDSLKFGNGQSTVLSVNAYDLQEGYALFNIGINILIYNKSTGEIEVGSKYFGSAMELDSGPVFLLRNEQRLYTFGSNGFILLHNLDGENNFPFQYIHTSDGLHAYFRYRDTELWRTDGTTEGTVLWKAFNDEILFLHQSGDSLHCITGGNVQNHAVIHKQDKGEVIHPMPGLMASKRIFNGNKLELKGHGSDQYYHNWIFYSLEDRTTTEVHNPNEFKRRAYDMKEKDGWYYASHWGRGNSRTYMDIGTVFRVNFDNGITELMVETDSIYQGMLDLYPLNDGRNVLLGSVSPYSGAEVYSVEPGIGWERLKEIYPDRTNSLVYSIGSGMIGMTRYGQSIEHGGYVYFTANSPQEGTEIWRTDGTTEGTKRFSDFVPGPGGARWISYFKIGEELYAALKIDHNHLEFHKIDTSFEGFEEAEAPAEDTEWDRYLLRQGPSYNDYMSPLKEPRLFPTSQGFVGLLQGYRTNANYYDRWIELGGSFEKRMPEIPFAKNGNMLYWLNHDGDVTNGEFLITESDKCDMALVPNTDDLIITFEHKDWSTIGGEEIRDPGLFTALARLNAQGDMLWYKLFNFGGNMRVVDIKTSDQHIYLVGTYAYPTADFGNGITLSTAYSQQYFLACFQMDGTSVWAVNTSMEGLNRYSTLGQMALDEKNKRIFTVFSEHTLNTVNTCEYGDWQVRINAIDMNSGASIWMQDIIGNDLIRVRDIASDKLGQLWLVGNFRGKMEMGQHFETASGDGNCPNNAFLLALEGGDGTFLHFNRNDEIHKRGRKLMPMGDYMDVLYLNAFWDPEDALEPFRHRRVSYLEKTRFSLTGNSLGNERFPTPSGVYFGGYANDEERQIKTTMCAAGDGHYIIKLAHYGSGHLGLGVKQAGPNLYGKSATTLIKRKNPEFYLPDVVIDEEKVHTDFILVPNPTNDRMFRIIINPGKLDSFENFKVYDAQGKLVMSQKLDRNYYSRQYSLPSHLLPGVYIVRLEGINEMQSQRLVLLN